MIGPEELKAEFWQTSAGMSYHHLRGSQKVWLEPPLKKTLQFLRNNILFQVGKNCI